MAQAKQKTTNSNQILPTLKSYLEGEENIPSNNRPTQSSQVTRQADTQ